MTDEMQYPEHWKPADHEAIREVIDAMQASGLHIRARALTDAITPPPPPKPKRYGPVMISTGRLSEELTRHRAAEGSTVIEDRDWVQLCRLYVERNLWTDIDGNPLPYPEGQPS